MVGVEAPRDAPPVKSGLQFRQDAAVVIPSTLCPWCPSGTFVPMNGNGTVSSRPSSIASTSNPTRAECCSDWRLRPRLSALIAHRQACQCSVVNARRYRACRAEISAGARKIGRPRIVFLHQVLEPEQLFQVGGSNASVVGNRRRRLQARRCPHPAHAATSFHAQSHVVSSSTSVKLPLRCRRRVRGRFLHHIVVQLRAQRRPVETEIRTDARVGRDGMLLSSRKRLMRRIKRMA